jgi:hypothetical protein
MLRTSTLTKLLSVCLFAQAGVALAQQTPPAKPAETPPKLEIIEEGSDQPITVTPPATGGGAKITEKKEGGRVTEAKVKTGKSSYSMKGKHPASVAEGGNGPGSTLGTPQWTVLEFDLNKKKKTDKEGVPATADAPPPPPPATPPAK